MCILGRFQMKWHRENHFLITIKKILAHFVRSNLRQILLKNIFGLVNDAVQSQKNSKFLNNSRIESWKIILNSGNFLYNLTMLGCTLRTFIILEPL